MGVDRDITTMDSDRRAGKLIRLGGSDGHRREDFLFNKRGCEIHR